jgi:hypothetical protein
MLAAKRSISKQKVGPGPGRVSVKVEDSSFTAVTDTTTAASLCSVFVPVLLTPSADGTFALQWANQNSGGAAGPTLKKGSWMRVAAVG